MHSFQYDALYHTNIINPIILFFLAAKTYQLDRFTRQLPEIWSNCRLPFISNNCRKLPVFCEIAGFFCRKFLYLIYCISRGISKRKNVFAQKQCANFFSHYLVNERNQILYTGLNCELGQLGWRFAAGQNLKTQSNYQRSKFTEMAISVYLRVHRWMVIRHALPRARLSGPKFTKSRQTEEKKSPEVKSWKLF
jgi:hypothetical protein